MSQNVCVLGLDTGFRVIKLGVREVLIDEHIETSLSNLKITFTFQGLYYITYQNHILEK